MKNIKMEKDIQNIILEIIKFLSIFGVVVGYNTNGGWTSLAWMMILISAIIVKESSK